MDPNDIEKGDDWWTQPNSSGPFSVDDFDIESGMTLKPNGDFYGGKPALAEIRILLGSNAFNPINLYQNGEIDVAVAWGPLAGYFAPRQAVALRMTPVLPQFDGPQLPMVFDISVGVRKADQTLQQELDAALARRHHHARIA